MPVDRIVCPWCAVDAIPKLARVNTRPQPLPEYNPENPRSPSSARSGAGSTPRSPLRKLADYAETAIGLTGKCVVVPYLSSSLWPLAYQTPVD